MPICPLERSSTRTGKFVGAREAQSETHQGSTDGHDFIVGSDHGLGAS